MVIIVTKIAFNFIIKHFSIINFFLSVLINTLATRAQNNITEVMKLDALRGKWRRECILTTFVKKCSFWKSKTFGNKARSDGHQRGPFGSWCPPNDSLLFDFIISHSIIIYFNAAKWWVIKNSSIQICLWCLSERRYDDERVRYCLHLILIFMSFFFVNSLKYTHIMLYVMNITIKYKDGCSFILCRSQERGYCFGETIMRMFTKMMILLLLLL